MKFENLKKEILEIKINNMYIITQILLKNKEDKVIRKLEDLAIISDEKNNELKTLLDEFFKNCSNNNKRKEIENIIKKYRN